VDTARAAYSVAQFDPWLAPWLFNDGAPDTAAMQVTILPSAYVDTISTYRVMIA
jgi:hypothetical protein